MAHKSCWLQNIWNYRIRGLRVKKIIIRLMCIIIKQINIEISKKKKIILCFKNLLKQLFKMIIKFCVVVITTA